jgi:hypothetical protein
MDYMQVFTSLVTSNFGMVLDGCLLPFLVNKDYRYPDWPDTTGGTTHDTKKHDTKHGHDTMDVVSVPARHDDPRSRHAVPGRTRHEKATHLNTIAAH